MLKDGFDQREGTLYWFEQSVRRVKAQKEIEELIPGEKEGTPVWPTPQEGNGTILRMIRWQRQCLQNNKTIPYSDSSPERVFQINKPTFFS